jgi:hypothetical protein
MIGLPIFLVELPPSSDDEIDHTISENDGIGYILQDYCMRNIIVVTPSAW